MNNQKITTHLTDWFLKIALILYAFKILFFFQLETGAGFEEKSNIEIVLKYLILFIFSIMLFILERRFFFMILFSSTILIPTFFSLKYLSKEDVIFTDLFQISNEILLVAMSIFFMVRYFREHKRKETVAKKKSRIFKFSIRKQEKRPKKTGYIKESFLPDKMDLDK